MTALPEPIRELLTAISVTLDLPAPYADPDDQAAHRVLADRRMHAVRLAIRRVLADAPGGPESQAFFLRFQAHQDPPGYRTAGRAPHSHAVQPAGPAPATREDRVARLHEQAARDYAQGRAQCRAATTGLPPGDLRLTALAAEAAEATEDLATGTD